MSQLAKPAASLPELLQSIPEELRSLYAIAHAMVASGYFPDVKSLSQAVARLVIGQRLGLTPLEAFTGLYFVQGRLAMSASLMASRIKKSGRYDYRVLELSEHRCIIRFFERGPDGRLEPIGDSVFSMEDARKAGLVRPGSAWEKYPRNMLFARALANGARWFCADAVFGAYELSEARESLANELVVDAPAFPEDFSPDGDG